VTVRRAAPARRCRCMTTLTTTLSPALRAEHRVTHTLIEYCDLLICPLDEVEQRVRRELERNPALDATDEPARRPGEPGRSPGVIDARPRTTTSDRYPSLDVADPAPMVNAAVLADAAAQLDEADRALAAWILADLDRRGFLEGGPDGVARRLGIPRERVARVIAILRTVGPPGLCAADVGECLLLQLAAYEESGQAPPLARRLISHHLAELGGDRVRQLAAAAGGSVPEVVAARDFIRARLRPWASLDDPAPAVAAPEHRAPARLAADGTGEIEVEVVGDPAGRLRVDPLWADLAEGPALPAGDRHTLREHARNARSFLTALEERAETLRRIAAYAASRQRRYLRDGPAAHEPSPARRWPRRSTCTSRPLAARSAANACCSRTAARCRSARCSGPPGRSTRC